MFEKLIEHTKKHHSASNFVPQRFSKVPQYVLDHAPLIYLHSQESFWPSSLETHIKNCVILVGEDQGEIHRPNQADPFLILSDPKVNSKSSVMTSLNDIRQSPESQSWLNSVKGKPDPGNHRSAISPSILILVDKSNATGIEGTVDAFWFFFYSFNLGPKVADVIFGNHVSDWEHCMIRFVRGEPQAVHLSAHADGVAYTFQALEKYEKNPSRPVLYSALGTHAFYPQAGKHDYSLAKFVGPVDYTEKGSLWDPALNFLSFQYIPVSKKTGDFVAISPNRDDRYLACLEFCGLWGNLAGYYSYQNKEEDEQSLKDNVLAHIKSGVTLEKLRWSEGSTGPIKKKLDRVGMNQSGNEIKTTIS